MIDVLSYLEDRGSEFERHLAIAKMLEARVDDASGDHDLLVDIRHVNTLKSGLLIHLYNIVEAVTTRTLQAVGHTIVLDKPAKWTDPVMKEWIRAVIWGGEDRIGDGVLKRLTLVSGTLAIGASPPPFVVKGEPGSWNADAIKKVAERLGCKLVLTAKVRRAAYEKIYRDESSALDFLARKRNAIAHGTSTFEDGANDITLKEIENLASRVLPYLRQVCESYHSFLLEKRFLEKEEVEA